MKKLDIKVKLSAEELRKKLDLKNGEKGDKGDRGEKGDAGIGLKGDKGDKGDAGDIKDLSPEEIRDSLELLTEDDRLDAKAIKNLPIAIDKGISRSGGMAGMNVYVNESKKGIIKAIDFKGPGVSYSKVNGLDTITFSGSGGGGSPGGVQYDVQLNDGAGGFAGSNDLNFQGGYLTINGDSGYGQLQFLNSPITGGYAGAGISGVDNEIIVGALAGDMTFWSSQAMNFSADTGNTNMLRINTDGTILIPNLGGGGDQMVIVDNSGILSAQSLPPIISYEGSIHNSGGTVELINDNFSPGSFFYYGTDGSGTKGFFNFPSGPSIALETNGTPNGDQLTLNLVQGTNMTITDDGLGNVTFDSTGSGSMAIGGSVSGSTPGSILFIDSSNNLAQDNANLFWDASNKRLGIMNNAPAYELDVTGDTYISGHTGLGTTPNSSFDLTVGGDTNFSGSMQVANDVILAYSTGRVSVGTGTPTKPFNVFGDMYLSGAFFDSSLSPGSSGYILSSTGGSTVWISPSTLPAPSISAVLTASSITPVADGTYTVGLGLTQNGTITTQNGIITSVQQAS